MVRISDNGPGWKKGQTPFVGQPYHKNNSSSSSSSRINILIYLSESHCSEITNCFEHSDGIFTEGCLLKCDHEKADECIMTHVKNVYRVDKFSKVMIASYDV